MSEPNKEDDVVIIDDLSDFEDLEHEIQINVVKVEPNTENEVEGTVHLDNNTKLVRKFIL